jgi:3-phenylpropionate/trans-cinnamate dioxygenase ferredoxin subunit
MQPENLTWHRIALHENEIAWNAAGLAEIQLAGRKFCLHRSETGLLACAATCPHAGGRFADGYVDALGNLVCPLHRYRFNMANGRNVSGEGYYLKTYRVEEREDGWYLGF